MFIVFRFKLNHVFILYLVKVFYSMSCLFSRFSRFSLSIVVEFGPIRI